MFCHNKWNLSGSFRKDEALLGKLKTDSSSSHKKHFLQKSRLVIHLPLQRFLQEIHEAGKSHYSSIKGQMQNLHLGFKRYLEDVMYFVAKRKF